MVEVIIFDYGRTIVDANTGNLFPEVDVILEKLTKKKMKLALVSRSHHIQNRHKDIKRLKLNKYFNHIEVIPAENVKNYYKVLNKLSVKGKQCVVIGDQIKNDILPGNEIGAITIWIKKGKFSNQPPTSKNEKPDYTIKSLKELLSILISLN